MFWHQDVGLEKNLPQKKFGDQDCYYYYFNYYYYCYFYK